MIEVEHLSKLYGTHQALNGVTFQVNTGEILGLLGPNGAGKTTTMRILTGFMPPTSGQARVAGYDVVEDSYAVRQRVGYLPERVPVYPDMTLDQFVTFWARLRGVRHPKGRVETVLRQFDLYDRRHALVRSLSKGLRQRLGLAQALVHEPEVVILDEPTIGIDPKQVIEVREVVRSLARQHTVVFSSHILSEVEQVCDRVVIINHGRLIASGTTSILSQRLQPGQHLFVIVDASPDLVQAMLSSLPGVRGVQPHEKGLMVNSAEQDVDLRRLISTTCTQQGWPLLEMRAVEITLEDIFLNLTSEKSS